MQQDSVVAVDVVAAVAAVAVTWGIVEKMKEKKKKKNVRIMVLLLATRPEEEKTIFFFLLASLTGLLLVLPGHEECIQYNGFLFLFSSRTTVHYRFATGMLLYMLLYSKR